ncbi:MAG: CPBP family intramembrane metalloprotease [Blastocatellia bacterium]|nr:CPBP family intramembrane metalloprotease [Blastocatellia bacterium]
MTITYQYRCPKCNTYLGDCEICTSCTDVKQEQVKQNYVSSTPDNPYWSVRSAFLMWGLSVFLIIAASLLSSFIWIAGKSMLGHKVEIQGLIKDQNYILFFIFATFIAQLITIAATYNMVTLDGKSFFDAVGWYWHPKFKVWHASSLTILVIAISIALSQIFPNQETDLDKLLQVGMSVRIATAFVAIVGAPIAEEIIYRGILYSALKKRYGMWPAIFFVSLLFLAVHVPQYWPAQGILISLFTLSFFLTTVRAYTRSLLPSYAIHLIFNFINGLGIIVEGLVNTHSP